MRASESCSGTTPTRTHNSVGASSPPVHIWQQSLAPEASSPSKRRSFDQPGSFCAATATTRTRIRAVRRPGYVHEIQQTGRCIEAGLLQSPPVPWQSSLEVMQILDTVRGQLGVTYPSEHGREAAVDRVSDAAGSAIPNDLTKGVLT